MDEIGKGIRDGLIWVVCAAFGVMVWITGFAIASPAVVWVDENIMDLHLIGDTAEWVVDRVNGDQAPSTPAALPVAPEGGQITRVPNEQPVNSTGGYNYNAAGDLDCAHFGGSVPVYGGDPHGLDADGDGVGCEANELGGSGSLGGNSLYAPPSSDLDCSSFSGSVVVGGSDPNGLDGDGDGIGCE